MDGGGGAGVEGATDGFLPVGGGIGGFLPIGGAGFGLGGVTSGAEADDTGVGRRLFLRLNTAGFGGGANGGAEGGGLGADVVGGRDADGLLVFSGSDA